MKKFLISVILLLSILAPRTAHATAGDIKISIKAPNNTTWTDTIIPTAANKVLGTNGSGVLGLTTSGGTSFPTINVKSYGATGDGTTDDTAAINSASTAIAATGGTLYFPAGTYITSGMTLYSNENLLGEGNINTVIKLKNATNTDLLTTNGAAALFGTNSNLGVQAASITSLTLDGNKTSNSAGAGLSAYWYECKMTDVVVRNCAGRGIREEWGTGGNPSPDLKCENQYRNVSVVNCDATGATESWYMNGPHDSVIYGSFVLQGIGTYGLRVGANGTGIMFENCHVAGYIQIGRSPSWAVAFDGAGCFWNDSTAEGGSVGQILVRANQTQIIGGFQYNVATAFNEAGIQIGDSANGFTNISGTVINTLTTNFFNGSLIFNSNGGYSDIHITGYNTTGGSTIYTGSPVSTDNFSININGPGGATSTNIINGPWQVVMNNTNPALISGTKLHLVGVDSTNNIVLGDSSGDQAGLYLAGRSAGGTLASPSGSGANKAIVGLLAYGYANGTYVASNAASINLRTLNAWSVSDNSTYFNVLLTPSGSTAGSITAALVLTNSNLNLPQTTSSSSPTTGSLTVGNGTAATNVGIGGGNVYAGALVSAASQLGVNGAPTSRIPVLISPSATASTGSAIGVYLGATDTAAANSDTLYGVQSTGAFATTNGGLTGLQGVNLILATPSVSGSSGLATSYQLYIAAGATATTTYGLFQAGTDQNQLAGSLTVNNVATFSSTARASGVASYFTVTTPTDTGQTASTESIGVNFATATRTWATTGTVANQREVLIAGKTYASAGASQTFTDISTLAITPPIQGTNAIFTRGHSLQIVDSTSAASSITGGLVVATTLGTTATSVGIGAGNVNAGGLITGGTITSTGAFTASGTSTHTGAATFNNTATFNGTNATTAVTITNTARTSGVLPYFKINTPADTGQTAATAAPGVQQATATRTWATTGTVAAQWEWDLVGPTYASASPSQTFTDVGMMHLKAPIAGSNAIFTRLHTLGIEDSTSAATPITGGLVVYTTLGTAATSVGIGGGSIAQGGKTTYYNNVVTAGWGQPAIYGAGRLTGQTAAVASISTYTVGAADGSFEVSFNMNVTAATSLVTTATCTYTDESNASRVMVFPIQQLSGSFIAAGAITGTGAWESPVMHIRCKASTSITIGTTAGTFTGITYTAEGIIKEVN